MSHARPTPHQNTLHVVAQGDKCYRHADAPGCAAESISYMSYLVIQGWYITRIHFDEGFIYAFLPLFTTVLELLVCSCAI